MARVLLARRGYALVPLDDEGLERVRAVPEGEVVAVEFTRPRNSKFHRLFFGLLNKVAQNSGYSTEELLGIVKLATGHCYPVKLPNGMIVKVPKSISFAKMDETAFRQFWDRAIDYLLAEVIPGTGRAELEQEVFLMLGIDLEKAA